MKINKNIKNELKFPSDMDEQCIELYYLLNSLPDTATFESCCGHERGLFMMCFRCDNIGLLTRLGRAVSKSYSDGNWEILVDSVDSAPYGYFLLRTNKVLPKEELDNSLDGLLNSIRYWFSDEFDDYFKKTHERRISYDTRR